MNNNNLEFIQDFRRGDRLEIIIPTYNEEERLPLLIELYKDQFDLVVMDNQSSDLTKSICLENKISYSIRTKSEKYVEFYIEDYANNLTKSGMTFYLFADEYTDPVELLLMSKEVSAKKSCITGNRVDWVYGAKLRTKAGISPRGFIKGDCYYDHKEVHSCLRANFPPTSICLDIEHYSLYDMKSYIPKLCGYVYDDIQIIMASKSSLWRYIRRFIIIELIYQPIRFFIKELGKKPAVVLWVILQHTTIAFIAAIMFLEKKYLISVEDQKQFYLKKMKENILQKK